MHIDVSSTAMGSLESGDRYVRLGMGPYNADLLLIYRPTKGDMQRLQTQIPSAIAKIWILKNPSLYEIDNPRINNTQDFSLQHSLAMAGSVSFDLQNTGEFALTVDIRGQREPRSQIAGQFTCVNLSEFDANYLGLLYYMFGFGPISVDQAESMDFRPSPSTSTRSQTTAE